MPDVDRLDEDVLADQAAYLSILAAAPAEEVKLFVEDLLAQLGAVEVLANRTGLVMLPYTDTVKGDAFFLGEVLVAEAHVRVEGQEGYAACMGRDLAQAVAIAILDARLQTHPAAPERAAILAHVADWSARQTVADHTLLRKIESTRVELEVF